MSKEEQLYRRNDSLNYLLNRKLSFIVQYGMLSLFFLASISLVALYFIKTPDALEGKFRLSSNNPPKSMVSRVNSRIVESYVSNLSKVQKGDVLLVLENVTNIADIKELESDLAQIKIIIDSNKLEKLKYIGASSLQTLGDLQQVYEQFKKSNNELYLSVANGQFAKEKNIINMRLNNLLLARYNLMNQKQIYEREYFIATENWQADSILFQQNSITKTELRNSESARLQRELSLSNLRQALLNSETAVNDIEQQLLLLEKNINQQKNTFIQSYSVLKAAIADWKSKYLFIAPFSGIVSLHKNIYSGLNIQIGEPLLYISSDSIIWLCEMLIPQNNFGKISLGQSAILKFDSYNFEEFGIIKGQVQSISSIPQEIQTSDGTQNLFLVQIAIDNKLITSYQKSIVPRYGLSGLVTIALDDKSLLEKLFLDKFKSIFMN